MKRQPYESAASAAVNDSLERFLDTGDTGGLRQAHAQFLRSDGIGHGGRWRYSFPEYLREHTDASNEFPGLEYELKLEMQPPDANDPARLLEQLASSARFLMDTHVNVRSRQEHYFRKGDGFFVISRYGEDIIRKEKGEPQHLSPSHLFKRHETVARISFEELLRIASDKTADYAGSLVKCVAYKNALDTLHGRVFEIALSRTQAAHTYWQLEAEYQYALAGPFHGRRHEEDQLVEDLLALGKHLEATYDARPSRTQRIEMLK